MKLISNYITEKLKINKDIKSKTAEDELIDYVFFNIGFEMLDDKAVEIMDMDDYKRCIGNLLYENHIKSKKECKIICDDKLHLSEQYKHLGINLSESDVKFNEFYISLFSFENWYATGPQFTFYSLKDAIGIKFHPKPETKDRHKYTIIIEKKNEKT